MVWVSKGGSQRVVEHAHRFVKSHAVLLDVRCGLAPIPLKTHYTIFSSVALTDQPKSLSNIAGDCRPAIARNSSPPLLVSGRPCANWIKPLPVGPAEQGEPTGGQSRAIRQQGGPGR